MTVTKLECPNCHGQLDIPEGMKEGFVSCKFCNTKVYIEPYKPNITQNFNIKEVNYNKPGATVRNNSKELNVIAIVAALGILSTAFLFVITLPLLRFRSPGIVSNKESYRTTPKADVMKSFSEKVFSKPFSKITAKDYASLQYLAIRKKKDPSDGVDKWFFSYSTSVDDSGKPVEEHTAYLPGADYLDEEDLQPFTGLVSLSIGSGFRYSYDDGNANDLRCLPNLQFFSTEYSTFGEMERTLLNPEKILGLSGVSFCDESVYSYDDSKAKDITDIYKSFSSLQELSVSVDSNFEPGISVLSYFPNLEYLALRVESGRDEPLDLSPLSSLSSCKSLFINGPYSQSVGNLSVLSGMPQIENLGISNIPNFKDLQFAQNMPKLKSLHLVSLPILSLDGLSNISSLNSLYLDCSNLKNADALSSLTSLQTLGFAYHNYEIPDLHGLSALENAEVYCNDLDKIAGMPSLKSLTIHNNSQEYEGEFLRGMDALSDLVIVGNGIIGEVQPSLGPALRELPSLQKLTFRGTPMDSYQDYSSSLSNLGVRELYFLLEDDSITADKPLLPLSLSKLEDDYTVEVLNLSLAKIQNLDDETRNFYPNAKAYLSHFKALKRLYISGNTLENLDCIEGLTTLEELDISENYISDVSALRNFPNLKKVKLSGNPVVNAEMIPDSIEIVASLD